MLLDVQQEREREHPDRETSRELRAMIRATPGVFRRSE